ncbi:MAG: molybdopterin molybdotransferase MoeA, partial [Firmicutes bacterium]|nr:molybdopterin molybdotransferase MoeA [Bacillota bacterium]
PVPGFHRSTVDGYAVRSSDTGGASESLPVFLKVIGEVEMGKAAEMTVGPGECVYVPTGGMVPAGADAMVMVEYCEGFGTPLHGSGLNESGHDRGQAGAAAAGGGAGAGAVPACLQMAVSCSVSAGANMVMAGDDMAEGQQVLQRGRRIRPADLGVLSAIGRTEALVYRPWKLSILSTGDEIVAPDRVPGPGQVRDVNTYGLYGQALEYGFQVVRMEVVCDDPAELEAKAASAMADSDLVVLSGGSSQGKKDATAEIIKNLASSGVLTHGLAVKPGKPTILGYDEVQKAALIGLPGHPVAALILFREIVGGLWERLTGMSETEKKPAMAGIITVNLAASPGRKTLQLVTVDDRKRDPMTGLPLVMPVWGKSGLIRTMSQADGYIVMEVNDEGIQKGTQVEVHLL